MKSQAQNQRPDIADAEDTASSPKLQQCNVGCWHLLPELPNEGKEVLIAIKYDDIPIQAYLDNGKWKMSSELKTWISSKSDNINPLLGCDEWVYAWCELPTVPPVPAPF